MSKIVGVLGREVLDSRGFPTVEAEIFLNNGINARAIVPSGASKGSKEALELRDNDKNRFLGKGVTRAVFNINNIISKEILGISCLEQSRIDNLMIDCDGTLNKSKLGSNSVLAVSLAVSRAASKFLSIPLYKYISNLSNNSNYSLPVPMVNIINGGCHAFNNIDLQEFMILPVGADSFKHSLRMCSEIFHNLGSILKDNGKIISVGDEGGYAPNLSSSEEALMFISKAVEKSNYRLGEDIFFALDCAASELYDKEDKIYFMKGENKKYTSFKFVNYLSRLAKKYPIISIEDPMSELDWDGFVYFTKVLGNNIQVVGDDLFVTNKKLLSKGIKLKAANSILIKLNQIGTITETLDAVSLAKKNNYSVIISHRSGETEDTYISDFCVGLNCGQIKTGSMNRSERISKYNRLIRIEENIINSFRGYKEFLFLNKNR